MYVRMLGLMEIKVAKKMKHDMKPCAICVCETERERERYTYIYMYGYGSKFPTIRGPKFGFPL